MTRSASAGTGHGVSVTSVTHHRSKAAAAALAVAALLAALLPVSAGAGHQADGEYFPVGSLPAPEVTGKEIVDDLDTFVTDHPYRLTGGPTELAASETLRSDMDELGYETAVETLPVTGGAGPSPLRVVTAKKEGTTRPDDWIMFVGHYDTVPQTIWGAYDNGAGTNLIRSLARALADVPTNRSLVFAWYNGEEEGLLASARHAAQLSAADQEITAVLGFDMVGVAFPVHPDVQQASSCLCMFHGPTDGSNFRPLLEWVNHEVLEFPRNPREVIVVGNNVRNSDERSFANQGYPTLRWAGMRTAGAYPAYHLPDDTLDTMIETAGGREYLEEGSRNTLVSAYYTALTLDNHVPQAVAQATVDGRSVTVTAAASDDFDGPLSEFAWDFGDGTMAAGESVTHTYDAAGTYVVTLEVTDNLWSHVTATSTVTVTVQ